MRKVPSRASETAKVKKSACGDGHARGVIPEAGSPARMKRMDVRPLLARGVEPFPAIREALDKLGGGECLVVIAPFLPSPLIDKLGSEGSDIRVERGADGAWIVYFTKPN